MFAEPLLISFAERIAMDLPDDLAVLSTVNVSNLENKTELVVSGDYGNKPNADSEINWHVSEENSASIAELSDRFVNIRTLGFSERFRHQLLAIF